MSFTDHELRTAVALALHESSHAIVAIELGYAVDGAMIDHNGGLALAGFNSDDHDGALAYYAAGDVGTEIAGDRLGGMAWTELCSFARIGLSRSRAPTDAAKAFASELAALPAAKSDRENIDETAAMHGVDVDGAQRRARRIIRRRWSEVLALTKRLLVSRTIGREEIRATLDRTRAPLLAAMRERMEAMPTSVSVGNCSINGSRRGIKRL